MEDMVSMPLAPGWERGNAAWWEHGFTTISLLLFIAGKIKQKYCSKFIKSVVKFLTIDQFNVNEPKIYEVYIWARFCIVINGI